STLGLPIGYALASRTLGSAWDRHPLGSTGHPRPTGSTWSTTDFRVSAALQPSTRTAPLGSFIPQALPGYTLTPKSPRSTSPQAPPWLLVVGSPPWSPCPLNCLGLPISLRHFNRSYSLHQFHHGSSSSWLPPAVLWALVEVCYLTFSRVLGWVR
ncbi:hypothetical protein M9458_048569, partial [Cirrhinus mrigala]